MKIIQFWLWCENIDIVDKMTWKWNQDFHEIQQGWKGNEDENVDIKSIQNVEPSLTNLTCYIIFLKIIFIFIMNINIHYFS
jgi:hypothetical protein